MCVEYWYGLWQEPVMTAPIVEFNYNAQLTHNVPVLRQRYGLTGQGVIAGLWDACVVLSEHVEFGGRVQLKDSGEPSDHATHVAGTIAAAGIDARAGGMAPRAEILSFNFLNDIQKLEL